jgi:hypothetical protein
MSRRRSKGKEDNVNTTIEQSASSNPFFESVMIDDDDGGPSRITALREQSRIAIRMRRCRYW